MKKTKPCIEIMTASVLTCFRLALPGLQCLSDFMIPEGHSMWGINLVVVGQIPR